jgi:predicted Zn-dependent protease
VFRSNRRVISFMALKRIKILAVRWMVVGFALIAFGFVAPAAAQKRIIFVRDAEVENTIRLMATPLFVAAGLEARAIQVHLIDDRALNAFVANGLNIYLNTGLLMRADHAGQVIGVLAHETGHIQGGHLAQLREKLEQALIPMLLESLATLGAVAAGARAGNPNDWGRSGPAGPPGPTMTERMLLRYTRGMENSADQAGINLLERTGQSARGLMEFLEVLADQELLQIGRQDPYVRTHPITRERVEFVREHVGKSRFSNVAISSELATRHARIKAKMIGYFDVTRAAQLYKENDNSVPARYARAWMALQRAEETRARAAIDSLLRESPNDAFFLDGKAEIVMRFGRAQEARDLYAKAASFAPDEPLILQSLGNAELQIGDAKAALRALTAAQRQRGDDAETWRLLSLAYARDDQPGMAALAHAESASILGRSEEAAYFAERAIRTLPEASPARLRAQDIKSIHERRRR